MGQNIPLLQGGVAAPVAIGDVVDKYRVERVIGVGAMGVVVAARHVTLDQVVAIKFLVEHKLGSRDESMARFLAEARAAAKIESDHVCRVFDVGMISPVHEGGEATPYMIMEYLDGSDLEEELVKRGALEITEAVDYVLQVLDAIAAAHSLGIVHRDLKPANIFLARRPDGSRRVKVLDFGISKVTHRAGKPRITRETRSLGTPAYMAPEQIRDPLNIDHRVDLWAAGAILYETLTGEMAFVGRSVKMVLDRVLEEEPCPIATLRRDVPLEVATIIATALTKDRTQRWQSASTFARSLAVFGSIGVMSNLTNVQREVGSLEAISISRVRLRKQSGSSSAPVASVPSVVLNIPAAKETQTDTRRQVEHWAALQKRKRRASTAVLFMAAVFLCACTAALLFLRNPPSERRATAPTLSAGAASAVVPAEPAVALAPTMSTPAVATPTPAPPMPAKPVHTTSTGARHGAPGRRTNPATLPPSTRD